MSDSLAIAEVTEAIRDLLKSGVKMKDDLTPDPAVNDLDVLTNLPSKVRTGLDKPNRLNLFLYQTMPNGAWRNQAGRDLPGQVKPGESGVPPLALTLHYLITAYGLDDDEVKSHRLLGRAMRVLNDFPLLAPAVIAQPERVRIVPQAMTPEELSKLWMIFQTEYRVSAAYQVSVVLIDSTRPVKAAPPVLRRGPQDRGAQAEADLISPALESVTFDTRFPTARLGDTATIRGQNLDKTIAALFLSPHVPDPVRIVPIDKKAVELKLLLDPAAPQWAPGLLALAVAFTTEQGREATSAALPLALAVKLNPLGAGSVALVGGKRILTLTGCDPKVQPKQRVLAILGDRPIPDLPRDPNQPADTLKFDVTGFPAGTYVVRLRVDGVDSIGVVRDGNGLPEFDPNQKVTLN